MALKALMAPKARMALKARIVIFFCSQPCSN